MSFLSRRLSSTARTWNWVSASTAMAYNLIDLLHFGLERRELYRNGSLSFFVSFLNSLGQQAKRSRREEI